LPFGDTYRIASKKELKKEEKADASHVITNIPQGHRKKH
jgi:hypothetical protein